jgi:carboxymethylenebutenolidase
MCDQDHFEEDMKKYPRVTRREFGTLTAGVGLAMWLPRAAGAVDVTENDVDIQTPDGTADCYFVHPSSGAHAAVLMWPNVLSLHTGFRQIAKRLAESGYAVLVPNLFYRSKRAPVVPEGAVFADEATRNLVTPLARLLNANTYMSDSKAFVAWLDTQSVVEKRKKMATIGYCLGGQITMLTAAAAPGRVGAAASFHGFALVTKNPDSPHLLVPQIKAQYLFAIAENDDQREPDAKNVLREAFAKANLPAEIEVYAGAAHGWCLPDSPVYNEPQAERAWSRMLTLFEKALA